MQPIAACTCSHHIPPSPHLGQAVAHCTRSKFTLVLAAMITNGQHATAFSQPLLAGSMLDYTTGKSLEYRQLCKHPTLRQVWSKSFANELGHLCQDVGSTPDGSSKCVKGTDTFYVIDYDDIPLDRRNKITYSKVVCKVRPKKSDPDCTRITIVATAFATPVTSAPKQPPLNLSN